MNYYNEIKNKLIDDEIYAKVKDYSKERHRVMTYFEIGRLLNEAEKNYGGGIIKEYSRKLAQDCNKKYSTSLLYKILQFYNICEKVPTLSGKLSWSHWYEMLSIKNINKIIYYTKVVEEQSLSVRELRSRIKNNEYERLPEETKDKLVSNTAPKVQDFIKNPIIIKNKSNYSEITEKILQRLILEDIPSFLDELGTGFTFIKNEYKIKIGERFNYIDLLLFNYEYNCFVIVELKVTELKKEHIGQIHVYMNYIDNNLRKFNQDKTIGIIICKKDNKFIMEYCSDKRILAKEYELI